MALSRLRNCSARTAYLLDHTQSTNLQERISTFRVPTLLTASGHQRPQPACCATQATWNRKIEAIPATFLSYRLTRALSTVAAHPFCQNPIYFDPEEYHSTRYQAAAMQWLLLSAAWVVERKGMPQDTVRCKGESHEFPTCPNKFDQVMFCFHQPAGTLGAGATICFGSDESTRQIQETSKAFEMAAWDGKWPPSLWYLP